MEHAKAIAQRIQKEKESPKLVFCSPFVRTVHTAQLVALDLDSCFRVDVCVEEGLTEWQISSLLVDKKGIKTNPKLTDELASVYGTIDLDYQSLNPVSTTEENVPIGSPHYPESEQGLLKRCSTTLERILEFSVGQSFVIVSHAPCDQALAINLEGTASDASKSKLGPWPLGGITKFSRTIDGDNYGAWNLDFYGDTEHMPGKYKAGLKVSIFFGGRFSKTYHHTLKILFCLCAVITSTGLFQSFRVEGKLKSMHLLTLYNEFSLFCFKGYLLFSGEGLILHILDV